MAMTVLILMISLSFPLSAGDAVGKKTQNGGREKDQTDHQIIKSATGVAPTLMARGNYGRLLLQKLAQKNRA